MNRREIIQSMALLSGSALFPGILGSFLTGCAHRDMSGYKPAFFTDEEYKAITDIVDVIIPATKTKSASQVNTHVFLDQVFSQCFTEEEKNSVKTGLQALVPGFNAAKDKVQYITEVDRKAFSEDRSASYFRTIKKFTMIGFFTSEEGETRASNYVKIPDSYKGEIPLDDHTLNYGKTSLHY